MRFDQDGSDVIPHVLSVPVVNVCVVKVIVEQFNLAKLTSMHPDLNRRENVRVWPWKSRPEKENPALLYSYLSMMEKT